MSEEKIPDPATLREALRQGIESGQIAQLLEQVKARAELGRSRLEDMESSLDYVRNLLETVRKDLTGESTLQGSPTAELLAEVMRQPAFSQLAVELLTKLLRDQQSTSS